MGLTNAVRDFFTQRIYKVLNEKIKIATSVVDEDKVMKEAIKRFCAKWGLDTKVLTRWDKITKEKEALDKEREELQRAIRNAMELSGEGSYWHNTPDEVENAARKTFRQEVLDELYPEVTPQVNHINKIKEDVEATVLLATTELKLRARLTAVLEKYGGSIEELLEYIPEAD
jgi:hypothetical protein